MITTVTLNAAIDKTYVVPKLEVGKVQRIARIISVPGGKGINVARVAQQLGCEVITTGFLGGFNGQFIEEGLTRQGIKHDFVFAEGESRLCLNTIDESTGASTELLEPGVQVDGRALKQLVAKVEQLASKSRVVVLSGSLPQGVPVDYYAALTRAARAQGAAVFLDTSGQALVQGVSAAPDFIKPNEDEVSILADQPLTERHHLIDAMKKLIQQGVERIAVTLGAHGAVASTHGRLLHVTIPTVEAVNPVGCGDAFVAGMAASYIRGECFEDSLRLASATATANALTESAGNVRLDDVQWLLPLITINSI
jgi:tagatose 6-phosphate kinase